MTVADPFDDFEREGWARGRAAPYHHGLGAITARPIEALLDAAGVGEGDAMLDVATGPGYVAAAGAARGAKAVGVDLAAEMLELAARLHPEVEFREADAAALPFADATFDAVTSNFLMPHVSDLGAVVIELARVLRPGRRLALVTWDPEPTTFLSELIAAIAAAGAKPPPDLPAGPPFFQGAADDEFQALLRGAGLEDPAVQAYAFTHHVDDFDPFWTDLLGGTVRSRALIVSQPPEIQARIRDGYAERLEPWRVTGGYDVPCAVKLGAATKPS